MKRAIAAEEGFSMIEVLIAAIVLVLGALATYSTLSSATVNAQRAKATQIALDRAQQEMELLRSLPEEKLAMTAAPPSSTHTHNPNYRVSNATFALTREPPSNYANMVINGGSVYGGGEIKGGTVTPGPTAFESGAVMGHVYRYIVWRNDASCPPEICPGEQDYKQIVVAVKIETPGDQSGEGGYVEVQSDFINPEKSEKSNPAPGPGGEVTSPQQFYLTNTPCAESGTTVHKEIEANNPLHNTLGTCASGPHTGTIAGAPDALLLGPPPDSEPENPSLPLYDYSSDYSGSPLPATAKGIQLRRDAASGCSYTQTSESEPQWKTHRWVTDPMPSEFKMFGNVTFDFYTRALSDNLYRGKVCIYLFDRHETGNPPTAEDKMLKSTAGFFYWTFTPGGSGYWPQGKWTEEIVTMALSSETKIPAGDRLGMALSVASETGEDAIPILYDNFEYKTRIELDTSTPLERE